MAIYQQLNTRYYKAENDLSTKQFHAVEITGNRQVDVCDAAADIAIGVLQNDPKTGEAAMVAVGTGGCKAKAGGTIAAGDRVGTDANGKVITKTRGWLLGWAEEAGVDNQIIEVYLSPGYHTA